MCRLLSIRAEQPFAVGEHLRRFAELCRESSEYQGHGWGFAMTGPNGWRIERRLQPIWECADFELGESTCLIAHARSAFRDQGIELANNMPFERDGFVFAFNGELRGVRLNLPGRTGAEKVFELIRRLDRGNRAEALRRAVDILHRQSDYVRALNLVLSDGREWHVASSYGENPEYFTLHRRRGPLDILCSVPMGPGFVALANGTLLSEGAEAMAC